MTFFQNKSSISQFLVQLSKSHLRITSAFLCLHLLAVQNCCYILLFDYFKKKNISSPGLLYDLVRHIWKNVNVKKCFQDTLVINLYMGDMEDKSTS